MNSLAYHISLRPLRAGQVLTPGIFGERILLPEFQAQDYPTYIREQIFERWRKSKYPERPSRLQSAFLYVDYALAHAIYAYIGNYRGYLYEVAYEQKASFCADMSLLHCEGKSFETIERHADKYWRGVQHEQSGSLELIVSGATEVIKELRSPSVL